MLLPVDEHIGQVHIRALQRLARRRTLGVGEQRVEFLLEHLEAKLARRLMVFLSPTTIFFQRSYPTSKNSAVIVRIWP